MNYYRYESFYSDSDYYGTMKVFLCLIVYSVVKTTPCGVWIEDYYKINSKRFVLNNAKKRFAWPTKEEALVSFRARKRRQIMILRAQLEHAELALVAEPDGNE